MNKLPEHRDVFAEIAVQETAQRGRRLVESAPAPVPSRRLPLARRPERFPLPRKMETPADLRRELARMRRVFRPFLRDVAPPLPYGRICLDLQTFDWRQETDLDRHDALSLFVGRGRWERVQIPHYGPPLGRATAWYRALFHVSRRMLAKGALFACFKGVDYQANVFVNGSFAGSHEGFFAPFEFDITPFACHGANTLMVQVKNDAICMGNESWGKDGHLYEGDKIYAASGPGYDDPEVGWHHCPPGMGIYQPVRIEARSRLHIHDLFVRPRSLKGEAEAWIEIWNSERTRQDAQLELAIYGQNFSETVAASIPVEQKGLGPGVNYLRVPLSIRNPRVWSPESPWLYQLQARVLGAGGQVMDAAARQFGLRTFRMEETARPRGRFYLNCREVRLRGANTMGSEQQDVMKGDRQQLVDDILLAKIGHMNFWRLTQRPVQDEVYDVCDRLGLMTQTDLPLFGVLRRNQFCEAVRQAGEMERLVRAHPCNIMVSYINEPFPGAWGKPHRHLLREELERFFLAADQAVRLANPDRVIKAADGDYDPPAPGLPDNHCYCGWYNGHGVELGKLHKGWWQAVKPGWRYGCGEFGAEGLDSVEIVRKYYPSAWLPGTAAEKRSWTPDRIPLAQTGRFHYMWFETPHIFADWVRVSQEHQARMTRLMTEAFRRDCRMNSCAIHLFIDAFPSGWMKAIMDVDRQPKPAYFAYRDALTPLMVNLRTDRFAYYGGETAELEAWICNDTHMAPDGARLAYCLELGDRLVAGGSAAARVPRCSSVCQGRVHLALPKVAKRTTATVRLALLDGRRRVLHDTSVDLKLFPVPAALSKDLCVVVVGHRNGKAAQLVRELGYSPVFFIPLTIAPRPLTILIDDLTAFRRMEHRLDRLVRAGATALFLELPAGKHEVFASVADVKTCGMGARHFVARDTGHPLVAGFEPGDFRFWHDPAVDRMAPILETTFTAGGWTPILTSGNGGWSGEWAPTLAAAEICRGKGLYRLCQVTLAGRTATNPVAALFARRLLQGTRPSIGEEVAP